MYVALLQARVAIAYFVLRLLEEKNQGRSEEKRWRTREQH